MPGSVGLGVGRVTVLAVAVVFFAFDCESNGSPDFPELKDEFLLSSEKIEGPFVVLELEEDVFLVEDPPDPLLLFGQPASSFTIGRNAIAEKSSVMNNFFINITVLTYGRPCFTKTYIHYTTGNDL